MKGETDKSISCSSMKCLLSQGHLWLVDDASPVVGYNKCWLNLPALFVRNYGKVEL